MKFPSASVSSAVVRGALIGLLALDAASQVSLEWSATQPDNSGDEVAQALAVGPDGSAYFAHQIASGSSSNLDIRLLKYTSNGAFAWLTEWDTYGFNDAVTAMFTAPNGDLFVAGSDRRETTFGVINFDATLRKFSPGGVQQWFAASQGFGGTQVQFSALAQLSNGAVIAGGRKGGGGHLVRFSSGGALEWQRTLTGGAGGAGGTMVLDLVVLPDDSIVACGRRASIYNGAMTLWRYDAAGTELWMTMVDATVAQQSTLASVCITSAGRIAAAGSRTSPALQQDMALAQFDAADGSLDWNLYVDTSNTGVDEIRTLAAAPDGALWCAGRRHDPQSNMDTVILRFDGGGGLLSLETWAGGATRYDQPQALFLGSAGQAWVSVMVGDADRDVALLEFDSAGELSSQFVFDLGGDEIGFTAAFGPGEQFTVAGGTNVSGDYDALVLRADASDAPSGYCTAKVNSLGCAPLLSFTGASSASATSGFAVRCAQVRNQKSGLLLYSLAGPAALPFQGGYLCVAAPRRRTPITSSGGAASGDDCSGVFALDLNAFAAGSLGGAPAPELSVAGTSVHCQQWSRDPGSIAGSGLSSGLRYVVGP